MRNPEKIMPAEIPSAAERRAAGPQAEISPADAERMESRSLAMLAEIGAYVSARLDKALREKIAREKERLLAFAAAASRARKAAEEMRRALNPAYFIRKPLDIDMLEQ